MAELDLLRSLNADLAEPSEEARARARGRLLRHIRHSSEPHRRRLLVPAIAIAVAAATAAVIGVSRHGAANASAAPVLRKAARAALRQPAPPPLAKGEFHYTKSLIAYLVIDGDKNWVALAPKVREIWSGPTGGRLHETSSAPVFLSAADRERWIAAGRPQVNAPEATESLPPSLPLDLPTDPDALYAKLHDRAVGNANGTESEMLTEVGDALRETDASPALRAALYEVAARIPGIELVGPVTDRIGRHGIAVAYSSHPDDQRHELIFDPKTSALLGEEYQALAGNEFGYAPGTVIGYATYVKTGVVDRLGARP
jgi:hypothetical protein